LTQNPKELIDMVFKTHKGSYRKIFHSRTRGQIKFTLKSFRSAFHLVLGGVNRI